jgi:aspartyl-tRNA(Asn)/glutamyl-tRNA(Gln) amidotransferase subunit C
MAVSESDVQKIARLAHLNLVPSQLPSIVGQLNDILSHMDVLQHVDTAAVMPVADVSIDSMPLREDTVAPIPMQSNAAALTAESRDGFILVPRLSTHGDV